MIWIIVIAVIALVIFVVWKIATDDEYNNLQHSSSARRSSKTNSDIVSAIRQCKSAEDVAVRLSEAEAAIDRKVQESRSIVQEAQREGYLKVNTEWMNRFDELVNVSNTLNENLSIEMDRRMNLDRFHRYNNIWFRSVLMSDLVYDDYMHAKQSLDEIGQVLVSIGKGQMKVSYAQKNQFYEMKDMFKSARDLLYKRLLSINEHTKKFREKIGNECGERGRQWRAERMRGRE